MVQPDGAAGLQTQLLALFFEEIPIHRQFSDLLVKLGNEFIPIIVNRTRRGFIQLRKLLVR